MSRDLYLYALAGAGAGDPLGEGLAGEPLRRLEVGPVAAILGETGDLEAPAVTPEALAAHDAVVRRLAERLPALLPARFGQTVPDEGTLRSWIATREQDLVEALALVQGCVQMTLRVFAGPEAVEPDPIAEDFPEDLGPGARFLHARRDAAARARTLPEIAPLREVLRPLLRAERIERAGPDRTAGAPGRLHATAYDLVSRGEADAYTRTVAETAPHLAGWRVTATGPWPPYAFAPGLGLIR